MLEGRVCSYCFLMLEGFIVAIREFVIGMLRKELLDSSHDKS